MVEGAGPKRGDRGSHYVGILQNLRSSYAKHLISILFHEPVPVEIARRTIGPIMRFPVDLDDQLQAAAVEVGYIASDGMLPPEFQAGGLASKPLPEQDFGQG
ncbi:hypothetical protein J2W40_001822 [Sphingobium xenophagum]|uniref:Uncharacterized protein n=1 Tax=Sphingobium xenophagum TaxID=121428 RepID=A0ABU1X133_SPHXE|nr:hypothetical protein [Sphingobium xenophagum]